MVDRNEPKETFNLKTAFVYMKMIGNHMKKFGSFWLIFLPVAGVLFITCLNPFAPKLTRDLEAEDLVITQQLTPGEALQNFKVAYTFRDSLLYSNVVDSSFIFVYFDPNEGSSGQFVSWGKETDLRTTGRLFRHFQVIDLVWSATLYSWQVDNKGEISKDFNLTLVSDDMDFNLSGRAIFSFEKSYDDKWRITRWKDESAI